MSEKQELDLFYEKNRLKTFKNWPFKPPNKCTKEKMAAAGFHFTGSKAEPDAARCFVCFKELDGWEEDDDPWEEHSRRVDCPFIQLNKTEDEMTVRDMYDLLMKRMLAQSKLTTEKKLESYKKLAEEYEESLRQC